MDCLGIYEYDRSEDAECDLCGLKGGVMQYFNIHSGCSMLTAPSREGWLAHIPCCYYLSKSNYLAPLLTDEELPSDTVAHRYYRKFMQDIAHANSEKGDQLPSNECITNGQVKDLDSEEVSLPNLTGQLTACEDRGSKSLLPLHESTCILNDTTNAHNGLDCSALTSAVTSSNQDTISTGTVEFEVGQALNDILSQLCNEEVYIGSNKASFPELHSNTSAIAAEEEEEESSSQPHLPLSSSQDCPTTAAASESPLSRFDLSFGNWRCSLCGLHSGLTFRCATVTCTVRCHPVCAYLSSVHSEDDTDEGAQAVDEKQSSKRKSRRKWLLCSAIKWNGLCNTGENLTIFCPVHSFGQQS